MRLRSLFIVAGAFLGSQLLSVEAQSEPSGFEALLACQSITDDAERLSCLDEATKKLSSPEEATAPAAPDQPAAQPTPEQAPPPDDGIIRLSDEAAGTTQAERDALAAERAALAAERAELEAQRAEFNEEQRAEEEEESIPIWARLRRGLETEDDIPNEYAVSVVKITRNNVGRHFFYTDDGYVWEQVETEEFRPPGGLPSAARIRRGAFGSQRIVFDDRRASTTRVRPTG